MHKSSLELVVTSWEISLLATVEEHNQHSVPNGPHSHEQCVASVTQITPPFFFKLWSPVASDWSEATGLFFVRGHIQPGKKDKSIIQTKQCLQFQQVWLGSKLLRQFIVQDHCKKSVIVLLMQTPCWGVWTQSYRDTGPCWPPLEPPLPVSSVQFPVSLRLKIGTNYANVWHGIKGGASDEAFPEQWFLWERRAPVKV